MSTDLQRLSTLPGGEAEPVEAGFEADFTVLALMRASHQRLHGGLERRQRDDLSPTQFELMVRVLRAPEASQGELAEALAVNRATVVGWVDRLVADGLLKRAVRASDRRVRMLQLTAKGRHRLMGFERRLEEALRPYRQRLGPDGYSLFVSLLAQFDGAGERVSRSRPAAGGPPHLASISGS